MAVDIKEAIRRLFYQYKVEGADEVMAAQEAVAASTSKTDKASLSLEKSFSSLERRYVETVRSQQDYAKVQDKVNAAVAQNPELQERANVVLAEAKKHFDNMATGADKGSMAAAALARTLTRTIGPIAIIAAAVAALTDAIDFFYPSAVRLAGTLASKFAELVPAVGNAAGGIKEFVEEGVKIELVRQKSEAVAAALKGMASKAQLEALKRQSDNEKYVSDRTAGEAAQARERAADHVRRLLELYPRATIEEAKQLELNEALLVVAQARTEEEKANAQEKLRQVQLTQAGMKGDQQELLLASERKIAFAGMSSQVEDVGDEIKKNIKYTGTWTDAVGELGDAWGTLAQRVSSRLSMLNTQFSGTTELMLGITHATEQYMARMGFAYDVNAQQPAPDIAAWIGAQNIGSPAAASASLANVLSLGLQDGLSNVNRLIDAVSDPSTQANLVQQAIDYIQRTQPAGLAREEMINDLNSKLEQLTHSTDSLNSTMQNALSPFYSQDPRTTHLGFRAGVVGNPEWQVGGASNTNPLAAILGPGAVLPGMANGGSFVVGGGYSANDNKIAAFPVASGEEVIVNRNRAGAKGGQVIHIDNRTIINGRVDADVFAQMKVSKYQQAQRMRAGLAAA